MPSFWYIYPLLIMGLAVTDCASVSKEKAAVVEVAAQPALARRVLPLDCLPNSTHSLGEAAPRLLIHHIRRAMRETAGLRGKRHVLFDARPVRRWAMTGTIHCLI